MNTSTSEFEARVKEYLESKNIQQILCMIKHPQSNGKIEKWFDTYAKHRNSFKTKKEFLYWYNEIRTHRSLNFDVVNYPEFRFALNP